MEETEELQEKRERICRGINMTPKEKLDIERWAQATLREKYDAKKFGNKIYHTYNKGYPQQDAYEIAKALTKMGYDTMVSSGAVSSTVYIRERS